MKVQGFDGDIDLTFLRIELSRVTLGNSSFEMYGSPRYGLRF